MQVDTEPAKSNDKHRGPMSIMSVVLEQNEDLLAAIIESQRLGEPFRAAK